MVFTINILNVVVLGVNYPCLPNMDKLQGDFASYGCRKFEDINTFEVWKPKK